MAYDHTCKYLAEHFSVDLATWLLGEPIPLTKLEPSELTVDPIRADALIFLESTSLILHIEFQTEPKADIPFRMLDYRVRGFRRYPKKEMKQVVIYLNPSRSALVHQTEFTLSTTRHQFEVIRLWEQPSNFFLSSPGLYPFAPLSQTADPAQVLQTVARQIEQIQDATLRSNLAASTAILSGLVLEKDVIQKILRQDIMRESVIYQDILAEGEAKGEAKGQQEGREAMKREIIVTLLQQGIAPEQVVSLIGVDIAEVRAVQDGLD